jgi:hypothetical protein
MVRYIDYLAHINRSLEKYAAIVVILKPSFFFSPSPLQTGLATKLPVLGAVAHQLTADIYVKTFQDWSSLNDRRVPARQGVRQRACSGRPVKGKASSR